MSEEMKRFQVLLSNEDMKRLSISERDGFCVDVHGMSCHQTMQFLKNIIAMFNHGFTMNVIHGYNRGHAIKDMLREDKFRSSKKIKAESVGWNPGMTKLTIA